MILPLQCIVYLFTILFNIQSAISDQTGIEYEIISSVINSELQAELSLHSRDTIFNKKGQIRRIKGFTFSSIYLGANTVLERYDNPDTLFRYCTKVLSEMDRDIFDDFIRKNLSPIKLDSLKGLQYIIKPIPENFLGDGHYPIIRVSRPGISKMNDQAFIYYSRRWVPLAGYGAYYLLRKSSKGWIIERSLPAWIS